jgi:hypothetical protein
MNRLQTPGIPQDSRPLTWDYQENLPACFQGILYFRTTNCRMAAHTEGEQGRVG